MNTKLLLGSTALVSAGVLLAGTAPARADIEVKLSGYTEFGAKLATDDSLSNNAGDRGYSFFMDNEIHVRANGSTDSGINYGSKIELDVGSNNAGVDEAVLTFSGGFGRVELGRDDGAEDVMYVDGEDAQAGTGGIDGDTANLGVVQFVDSSDAAKVTYFTPRFAGFQVGGSFVPDGNDQEDGRDRFEGNETSREKWFGLGVNWVGGLGPVDMTLAAVGSLADGEGQSEDQDAIGWDDDAQSWAVGGLFEFAGFTLGAGYNKSDEMGRELDIINVGLKYGFGPANVSVGYTYNDYDRLTIGGVDIDADDSHLYAVSADYNFLPGMTLKGDVTYNSDDPNTNDRPDTTDTWAGVITVQLDY